MNLKTYQVNSKQRLKMSLRKGSYAKLVVICRRNFDYIKEKYKKQFLTLKDNQKERNLGLILNMSGWEKLLWQVNQISINNYMKLNLGVIQHTTIKYLEYQLVMQEWKKVRFRIEAPVIQYHQKISNICCLSSLANNFTVQVTTGKLITLWI